MPADASPPSTPRRPSCCDARRRISSGCPCARRSRSGAEQIRRAEALAASITQQMLAFSRRQIIALMPVDLNELIAGAEAMLKYVLGSQILLVTHLDAAPSVVLADASQLTQVLVNLTLNARDAMPDGGIFTFRTARVDLERGALSPAEDAT